MTTPNIPVTGASYRPFVVASNRALAPSVQQLRGKFDVHYLDDVAESKLEHVAGLLTTGWDQIDSRILNKLPNLKVISHMANGLDTVDLAITQARNITLFNTPDVVVNDTADLALAMVLNLSRRVLNNHEYVKSGRWGQETYPLANTLSGKRAGIVGLGRIGKAIAKRCLAFDMEVSYWGRTDQQRQDATFQPTLSALAETSDFLIISCVGVPETSGLIDRRVLKKIKPSGYLINVSRGFIVDEVSLVEALVKNRFAGAGLDVFEDEPRVPDALLSMDNVVLQPHAGSATQETRAEMFRQVAENLSSFFARGH